MPSQPVRNDLVAVGATAVLLCDNANPADPRQFVYMRNSSAAAQVMTLVFGDYQTITVNKGIVLTAFNSYYEVKSEGFEVWQGRIWAICDAAAGQASVVER